MRILLTNDDGINAEGLAVLERIAASLSDDVWVCAPEYEQSGASRALTLDEPIRVRQVSERKFTTTGTPTDCVMMAIREIMKDNRPDLVLSGVNNGSNLCEDVTMSGTVAGAIEAMALGVPAIALSQVEARTPRPNFFEPAETYAGGLIKRLVELGWPADVILSINFPSRPVEEIEAVEITRQGFRDRYIRVFDKRTDPNGRDYYWIGYSWERSEPALGTELRAIYEKRISVTPLHIDLTHGRTIEALKALVDGPPPAL